MLNQRTSVQLPLHLKQAFIPLRSLDLVCFVFVLIACAWSYASDAISDVHAVMGMVDFVLRGRVFVSSFSENVISDVWLFHPLGNLGGQCNKRVHLNIHIHSRCDYSMGEFVFYGLGGGSSTGPVAT